MKPRMIGVATLAAMAPAAFAARSASATTLEVGGVVRNSSLTIEASATEGVVLSTTAGGKCIVMSPRDPSLSSRG
jgi:hypothetical protein